MQFDRRTCGQIAQVTRISHFMQIMWLLTKKNKEIDFKNKFWDLYR